MYLFLSRANGETNQKMLMQAFEPLRKQGAVERQTRIVMAGGSEASGADLWLKELTLLTWGACCVGWWQAGAGQNLALCSLIYHGWAGETPQVDSTQLLL